MRRAVVLLVAVLGLALGASVGVAAAETFPASQSFTADLGEPEGYPVQLRTEGQTVELAVEKDDPRGEARGGGQFVALYSTTGKVGRSGIEARFGKLGEIDLTFRPTPSEAAQAVPIPELPSMPAPTCKGRPAVELRGDLRGTLRFEGAEGYVRIDRTSVPAEYIKRFRETCTYDLRVPAGPTSILRRRWGGGWAHTVVATKKVGGRETFYQNEALTRDGRESGTSSMDAGFLEYHEGVRLLEHEFFDARSHFRLLKRGSDWRRATVRPPAPFSGAATFTRAVRGARPTWRGSLRISLPGAPDLKLTGAAFKPDLCGPRNEFRCMNEFYR
jgi:hypothetical protein